MRLYPFLSSVFLSLFLFISCQNQSTAPPDTSQENGHQLGQIYLEVTGDPEAQAHFKKGLLLLHSFEFDDAATAFDEALAIDSNFVMATWGKAMTHNHPLWREQDTEAAREAMSLLGNTPEERLTKVTTELEKDLWQAIEVLYGPDGDKKERDIAYNQYLEKLQKKYPKNHEVSAFYALSCLGAVKLGRDVKAYEKGAAIAQSIIDENPNHPGALHYLIHSYDDPEHAALALTAANSYSKVAPDAAHALHMPSHIYVALGMWDEVISSNIASWEASIKRMQRKELDNDARSYHALHWLLYGYLQKGNMEKADRIMADMQRYFTALSSKEARNYMIAMKGNYLVDSNNWDSEFANIEVDDKDLNIQFQAMNSFMNGYQAWRKKDLTELKEIIDQLVTRRTGAGFVAKDGGAKMCSNTSAVKPNKRDVDKARLVEIQLRALQAQLQNKSPEAEKHFKDAIVLLEEIKYSYGPPKIILPPYEMYGDWLLSQNRKKEALEQFQKALNRGPKRKKALRGKALAQST